MNRFRFLGLFVMAAFVAWMTNHVEATPEVPGAPQTHAIALVGGTIHPVSGPAIEHGTLVFDKGKITIIEKGIAVPAEAHFVDVSGKHVYPGLIDANSQLGLVEIPSVRGTRDLAETGEINPNVKAQVAFNPDSELIPVGRSGGILTVLTVPNGGLHHRAIGLHAARWLELGRHVPEAWRGVAHQLAADGAGRSVVGSRRPAPRRRRIATSRSRPFVRRLPTLGPTRRPRKPASRARALPPNSTPAGRR